VPGRTYGLGIHVTGELKALLESTADASGRSQGQEAAARIEASFDRERRLGDERAVAVLESIGTAAVARFGPGWARDPKAYDEITREGGLAADHFVRWRPTVTEGVPRVARPVGESASAPPVDITDVPDEPATDTRPGSGQRERELMEQLLQSVEHLTRLVEQMLPQPSMTEEPSEPRTEDEARPRS
jgi:hypothetical protein